jgi:hypothetical protein
MAERSAIGTRPLVKVYGRHGSALCYAIRDFLYRSDVPFEYVELSTDEEARSLAGMEHLHDSRLPVCQRPRAKAPGLAPQSNARGVELDTRGWLRSPPGGDVPLPARYLAAMLRAPFRSALR